MGTYDGYWEMAMEAQEQRRMQVEKSFYFLQAPNSEVLHSIGRGSGLYFGKFTEGTVHRFMSEVEIGTTVASYLPGMTVEDLRRKGYKIMHFGPRSEESYERLKRENEELRRKLREGGK